MISNFRIESIDFTKLSTHENVTLDKEGKFVYNLKDGSGFRWLKIVDNHFFGTLIAGTRKAKRFKQDFAKLDITIGISQGSNLQNQLLMDYKKHIFKVFDYLYKEYGISADYTEIKFNLMEINCTFEIDYMFHEYHRILKLIMFNLPQTYKKIGQIQTANKKKYRLESETFYRGNSSMELKIYDKKKQIEQVYHKTIQNNFMRIEIVLKKTQKIKEVFHTNLLREMTDEQINEFYMKQFKKLIEIPFYKWKYDNDKKIYHMILNSKRKRYWINNFLRDCRNEEQLRQIPILLDIKDFLRQLKLLEKNGHYKRIEKSVLKCCENDDVYLKNDLDKIKEIIEKVYKAFECTNNELNHTTEYGESL